MVRDGIIEAIRSIITVLLSGTMASGQMFIQSRDQQALFGRLLKLQQKEGRGNVGLINARLITMDDQEDFLTPGWIIIEGRIREIGRSGGVGTAMSY